MISSLSGQWNLMIKNISREPSHKCSKGNSVIWMDLISQSYLSLCLIFPLGRDDILCLDFCCSAHLAWNEGVSFLASRHGWLWMKNMNQPFLGAQVMRAQGSGFLPAGWPQGALFLCFFVLTFEIMKTLLNVFIGIAIVHLIHKAMLTLFSLQKFEITRGTK